MLGSHADDRRQSVLCYERDITRLKSLGYRHALPVGTLVGTHVKI